MSTSAPVADAARARRRAVPGALRPAVEHRLHRGQVRAAVRAAVRVPVLALRARRRADDGRRARHARARGRARCASIATSRSWRSCVHALYLGGVFVSLDGGMAAGTSAMLVGLQPILTVVLAWLLDARARERAAVGGAGCSGLAGVYFVVRHKIDFGGRPARASCRRRSRWSASASARCYQKRHCAHIDLRSGAAVQFTVCAIALRAAGDARSTRGPCSGRRRFLFALGWSVLVLSVGAISLLYWLLRHGAAANVARLFYLVPPVTALRGVAAVRRNARRVGADRHGADLRRRDPRAPDR